MKLILFAPLIVAIAAIVFGVLTYGDLPERIPIHFNLYGEPDRWEEKSLIWFVLPAMTLFIAGVSLGLSKWIHRYPNLINVPNQKLFLSLTSEQQQPILSEMEIWLSALFLFITLLITSLFVETWFVTTGKAETLPSAQRMIIFPVAIIVFAVIMIVRISRVIKSTAQR